MEVVDVTDADPDVIGLGFRSGVPLAYMNLLARGSGVEVARVGEKGAEETTEGLCFEGRLVPLA